MPSGRPLTKLGGLGSQFFFSVHRDLFQRAVNSSQKRPNTAEQGGAVADSDPGGRVSVRARMCARVCVQNADPGSL